MGLTKASTLMLEIESLETNHSGPQNHPRASSSKGEPGRKSSVWDPALRSLTSLSTHGDAGATLHAAEVLMVLRAYNACTELYDDPSLKE